MYNGELEVTNQRFLLAGSPYNTGKRKRLYCDKSNVMSRERERPRRRKCAHVCALPSPSPRVAPLRSAGANETSRGMTLLLTYLKKTPRIQETQRRSRTDERSFHNRLLSSRDFVNIYRRIRYMDPPTVDRSLDFSRDYFGRNCARTYTASYRVTFHDARHDIHSARDLHLQTTRLIIIYFRFIRPTHYS